MSEKLDRLVASAQEVIRQNAGLRVNGKGASNRTQEISEQVITECCRRLHRLGFYLANVDGMQKKHIDALVGSWYAQPMAPKTIQNLFSRVKIFCGWLEKSGIVSPLGAMQINFRGPAYTFPHVSAADLMGNVEKFEYRAGARYLASTKADVRSPKPSA